MSEIDKLREFVRLAGSATAVEKLALDLADENAALKRLAEKQFLFNDMFMERFHIYSRHKHSCTFDQLDKGDICTCGLQELITMYYEIKDALLTAEEQE